MINAEDIIEGIKQSVDRLYLITMDDYLKTKLRIQSYNRGESIYISKADFSDFTGWRRCYEGNLQEMSQEIHRMASFPGQVTWEELVNDEEDEEDES